PLARRVSRPRSVCRLSGATAPLGGARLSHVPVRALLVAARGDVRRLPDRRLAYRAAGGGDARWRERAAGRFLFPGRDRRAGRSRSLAPGRADPFACPCPRHGRRALRPAARLPAGPTAPARNPESGTGG